MRSLILDQYSNQPALTRWVGNSLTGLGWGFWIFLWLPLLATASIVLDFTPEAAPQSASHSMLTLLLTMKSHLVMVLSLIGLFIAWAILQSVGKGKRTESILREKNTFCNAMTAVEMSEEQLQIVRKARITRVSHESNGRIIDVGVITLTGISDFPPEPLPQAA